MRRGKPNKNRSRRRVNDTRLATKRSIPLVPELLRDLPPLFPARLRKLMNYHTNCPVSSTTGVPGGYVFIANGVYDPDITSTGHQPMGFDQMMLFYEQYTVLASTIRLTAKCDTAGVAPVFCVYLSPDTSVLTTSYQIIENGLVSKVNLNNYGVTGNMKELTLDCDVPNYFGRTQDQILNDPTLAGAAASNPSEGVYYILSTWDMVLSGSCTVYCTVDIVYDVVFWEPRKLTAS